MSTCTGKCCVVFNCPTTPAELYERNLGDGEDRFLADMLITLTPEEAQERALRFELTPPEGWTLEGWLTTAPVYTCRHWDEETRLCGVYDARPRMCADYPYDKSCQHDKRCTYRPADEVVERWAIIHADKED